MSLAYIDSQWTHPIAVADELESFFHVMLFWALRFLPHTLDDTAAYVVEYFDTFQKVSKDKYVCSRLKNNLMLPNDFKDTLSVEFVTNTRTKGSPLNTLIGKLLRLFQARYAVRKHEQSLKQKPTGSDPAPSGTNAAQMTHPLPQFEMHEKKRDWLEEAGRPIVPSEEPESPPLSDMQKELAKSLDTHVEVMQIFVDIMKKTPAAEWDTVWVVQDQLVDYEPRIVLANNLMPRRTGTRGTDNGPNKRPRTDGSTFATSSNQLAETTSSWSVLSNSGQTPA